VGFLTPLLWERYGPVWVDLVRAVGAEAVTPAADAVTAAAAGLPARDGALALLARASLRALTDVDLVLAPRLLPEHAEGPGSGQDPWVVDLPAMLARSEGRSSILGLPAWTGPDVETQAIALLTRLQPDAGRVRRAWAQHRVAATRPWRPRPSGPQRSGTRRVALAGAPWWCTAGFPAALTRPGETLVGQHLLDPLDLRAEGRRWREELVDSDAEALGAVRRFARRGDVAVVRLAVDPASAADAWLARRATELAGERLELQPLDASLDAEGVIRAALLAGPDPAA
jgi:hypothetical protein